jgi:hypothetical protein
VHVGEQGPEPLGDLPVEARIVGDDDVHPHAADEGRQLVPIDPMSRDHGIRDARELGDCRRDRRRRLLERLECIDDMSDLVVAGFVAELDHRDLDHFVAGGVEPGGLQVQ